ncbi:MAG TPA: PP2C family protein-serine/threonine phosphatase [Terriglobales bacterium]
MPIPWDQFVSIVLGGILVFVGVASGTIALIRHRSDVRLLVWLGLFSGIYGARLLIEIVLTQVAPSSPLAGPLRNTIDVISYLILIVALFFWRELTIGGLRRFNEVAMIPAAIIAAAGIALVIAGRSADRVMPLNNGLAVCVVLVLLVVSAVPKLSLRYLTVPGRVLAVGTAAFAAIALWVNLQRFLNLPRADALEPIGFTVFVLALGFVAAEKVFANERRLLSIENELEIARGIQKSILPASVPELERVTIAAAYVPMASVAGDFYDFVHVDKHRTGVLVADVSGHGVPAALIASMIKVAMQSVISCADNPAEVMRGLNRVLSPQLRGQFVTAAYLWMDTEKGTARYSAAGHPPLLYWKKKSRELQRIESNGLLFGVLPDGEYPVADLVPLAGDRIVLYTDGITEAEDPKGIAFGDDQLERVLRTSDSTTASEFSDRVLGELKKWQQPPVSQQDDLTLVVVDIL